MPIISSSGQASNSNMNGGGSDGFLQNSLDDEESFVVLERSTASDAGLNFEMPPQSTQPNQSFPNNCSFPVFNNGIGLSRSGIGLSTSRTSQLGQIVSLEPVGTPLDSNNISISAEEIQKQLQEVLQENVALKENLFQTNLAMKQQLSTVSLLQDRALEVQKNHQAKFEETKALIIKLNSEKNQLQEANSLINTELNKVIQENKELKEANVAFIDEASKILSDNDTLKKQVSTLHETMQAMAENGRRASLQQPSAKEVELRELVDQLSRKLEGVERARRQQEFDIDRLQAQLARATLEINETQRRLAHAENALQVEKENPQPIEENKVQEQSLPCEGKFVKYNEILKQLRSCLHEEQTRFNSLHSWLTLTDPTRTSAQFEIAELRRLLVEEQTQSVTRKEGLHRAVSTIHDLLTDYQKLGEDLERLRADHAVKESHGEVYGEMQKKAFREQLDELTAKLVEREESLAISERHLASLQEAVRLENCEKKEEGEIKRLKENVQALTNKVANTEEQIAVKNQALNTLKEEVEQLRGVRETVAVLEEQAKIYQDDFEAERKSRETLAADKNKLMDDLRNLQQEKQELEDRLGRLPREYQSPPATNRHASPRPQEQQSEPPPTRTSDENTELKKSGIIFHEKQQGQLCAQHCLNALLQGAHFNAVDLAELAQELDFAEKLKFAEAGVDSKEYQSFIKKPSENLDDTGYFSVQVIGCALQLWGLELVPYNSCDPRAVEVKNNPSEAKAFICNSHSHWFTIRRLGNRWFNLNSTLHRPEPISDFYLDLYLERLQHEKNSVFVVVGELPPCAADDQEFGMEPVDRLLLVESKVRDGFAQPCPTLQKYREMSSLHLKFSLRNFSPFFLLGERIGQLVSGHQ